MHLGNFRLLYVCICGHDQLQTNIHCIFNMVSKLVVFVL